MTKVKRPRSLRGRLGYAVYQNMPSYPGEFVVLRWRGSKTIDKRPYARGSTLAAVRTKLPPGLTNLGSDDGDSPYLVEVWI